jgi:hypothetical protein
MRYQIVVYKAVFRLLYIPFLLCTWLVTGMPAQQQSPQSREDSAYGAGFFDQLHAIFGRFREADLQRVFQEAQEIQCSELVSSKGEWRTVAFFNEDRRLGDWCKENLAEVKNDPAVYKFTGVCSGDKSKIQVATEFPTNDSIEAYNKRQIDFKQIDIMVNDPVDVAMNSRTMAYTFDLPYLFLIQKRGSQNVLSLIAPDRNASYVEDAVNRWECKLATSKDMTYRFLICRTKIIPRGPLAQKRGVQASFGSSGFFILSDGMKAQASVKIKFDDGSSSSEKPSDSEPAQKYPERPILRRPQP